MKPATSEPDGRGLRRKNVQTFSTLSPSISTPVYVPEQAPASSRLPRYACVEEMVDELKPEFPVHCLRGSVLTANAKWFLKHFPGDVLFAVKTNPDPFVLNTLAAAGIAHFDVASKVEIDAVVAAVPGAQMYFMHPVKSREAIEYAYFTHGVRHFSLDSLAELEKILDVTGNAADLSLYVRMAMPNEAAAYSLTGKFGIAPEESVELLRATREVANELGVCFHVGSQCMEPRAYEHAVARVVSACADAQVMVDIVDVGGGFPSVYPGMTPPPMSHYMRSIKKALKAAPMFARARVLCEPGRALVAEAGSLVVRVELKKGNMLYLNDGTYGSLFDAGTPAFQFPVKAMRIGGGLSTKMAEFGFFGPTCDSLDVMKGPFELPENINEGDFIEIGQLGAYGATMRTHFNGFYSDTLLELADKPMLSMLKVN